MTTSNARLKALLAAAERRIYRRVMAEMRDIIPVAIREASKKRKGDTDRVRFISGAVREVDGSEAIVHIDGDSEDETVAAKMIAVRVSVGQRVMVVFAPRHAAYTTGPLGGASAGSGTGNVDLSNYVQFDDLDQRVKLDYRIHSFPLFGDATLDTSMESPVWFTEIPRVARVSAIDRPTGSAMTFNFDFGGNDVLASDLSLPTSAVSRQPFQAQNFALGSLTPGAFPAGAALLGVCTQGDSNNAGGNVMLTLLTEVRP